MTKTRGVLAVSLLAALAGTAWWLRAPGPDAATAGADGHDEADSARVAVEAAPVTTGDLRDVRVYTGTLAAGDAFTVAPKTGGRVEQVHVDIGDRVERGALIAELDDAEASQAVAEARAALAVARAEVEQAAADARLAQRSLERTRSLAERDLASAADLDTKQAEAEARRAALSVARARVTQREAALARAEVQLGYTEVRADWPGGDGERVVGERMVSAGDTVAANTPLVSVLGLNPITAVVQAPEAGYARLARGQRVTVTTAALPERAFTGEIARIAPQFARDSRQARFEVRLANPERALKPGMFVEVRVTVATAKDATLVPAEAVVRRDGGRGVYRVVPGEPPTAAYTPVDVGIEGDERVAITEPALSGRVVTLGQQMLADGAPVVVSELPAS